MKHNLKSPCPNCPFRKEGAIELREGRLASIIEATKDDMKPFLCHKTTHGRQKEPSVCMGACAYHFREGRTAVVTRVALLTGMVKREEIEAVYPVLIESMAV